MASSAQAFTGLRAGLLQRLADMLVASLSTLVCNSVRPVRSLQLILVNAAGKQVSKSSSIEMNSALRIDMQRLCEKQCPPLMAFHLLHVCQPQAASPANPKWWLKHLGCCIVAASLTAAAVKVAAAGPQPQPSQIPANAAFLAAERTAALAAVCIAEAGSHQSVKTWLRAGTVFENRAWVAFAGVHSMQQQVYFYARQPALAILLQQQQPVQEEMRVQCTGPGVIAALRLAHLQMSYVRIVSQAAEQFTYNGVWPITDITEQSAESVQVDMISMPDLPST